LRRPVDEGPSASRPHRTRGVGRGSGTVGGCWGLWGMSSLGAARRTPFSTNRPGLLAEEVVHAGECALLSEGPCTWLPRRKREILYARAFRALSMRPALSRIFTSNELIRHCFLRRQAEKLPPTLRRHEKHSCGSSLNLRTLLVKSKMRGKAVLQTTFESQRDHGVPFVTRTPKALKIGRRDLTNRVPAFFESTRKWLFTEDISSVGGPLGGGLPAHDDVAASPTGAV
jgi:hypothetical protein